MQFIISLGIIALILFITSIIFFLIAISKKKMTLFYLALLLSFLSVGVGLSAGFIFIQKSYMKISKSLEPRTKEEIYTAIFKGNPNKCTVVLETQDQVLPVIDVAIYLHFKTCEAELNRILKQQHYEMSVLEKNNFDTANSLGPDWDWFKPLEMSDSIFVYTYKKDELGNYQTLFVSKKKDEVYCIDVWN
jgi:hypothetical protein